MRNESTPGGSQPNFTGAWKVNLEKSVLRGPAPKQILVTIEHRERSLIQRVVFTSADGMERRQTFTLETGIEAINSVSGATTRTLARWEGAELLAESWMKTPDREFHFKDYWSLSGDGRILTMEHRDDDLAGQTSVLERVAEI